MFPFCYRLVGILYFMLIHTTRGRRPVVISSICLTYFQRRRVHLSRPEAYNTRDAFPRASGNPVAEFKSLGCVDLLLTDDPYPPPYLPPTRIASTSSSRTPRPPCFRTITYVEENFPETELRPHAKAPPPVLPCVKTILHINWARARHERERAREIQVSAQ